MPFGPGRISSPSYWIHAPCANSDRLEQRVTVMNLLFLAASTFLTAPTSFSIVE